MSTAAARIFFIRHGETDWNAEGRLQGQQDIPLNRIGRLQAREVGERLKALAPAYADFDYVSSPMKRTRETMEILRNGLGLVPGDYRLDPQLVELTFGAWEGLTWKDVRERDPVEAASRERDKWGFVPPDGESYAMLTERVRPVIEAIARDTVIVSHGGVARAFLALTCGVSHRKAAGLDIWQGKVLVIEKNAYCWA
ncbi:histidine phosphatase family protein [Microvirga massiliensis]|uniref:histidine phosphatase family protein n=1 Tax=Microvirga massiliensis TaxID=1033741 RepID=UPI00062BA328|nr:histidine phosphatase family protein [Microvirga massiliensis]